VDDTKAGSEEVGVAVFKHVHDKDRWLIKAREGSGVQTSNWRQADKGRTESRKRQVERKGGMGKVEGRNKEKNVDTCSKYKSRDEERTIRDVDT